MGKSGELLQFMFENWRVMNFSFNGIDDKISHREKQMVLYRTEKTFIGGRLDWIRRKFLA